MKAEGTVNRVESYDNDELLMMLDDDLFPCGSESEESEK